MPSLSVIMIVKNEAGRLGKCLDSVRAIAGEIVIGDTGSEDDTAEIARCYGARVFPITWQDDFAAARNLTIAAATGDWLLHMDADEMLDPDGAARIRRLVEADGEGADAIEVTLANYCDDPRAWRWVPVLPDAPYARGCAGYIAVGLLRLFRNRRGFEYREPVHENITESVLERGGHIRREDILIHHYGYDLSATRSGGKAKKYLAIARNKLTAHPDDLKALHDFAEQALACGLAEEAEAACRHALAQDPTHLDSVITLANILLNRGDLREAWAILAPVEASGAAPAHVITALAAIACHEHRLDEALARFNLVLDAAPQALMARLYRARVFDLLEQPGRAQEDLECAAAQAPNLEEPRRRAQAHRLRIQGEHYFQTGQTMQALDALVQALRLDPEDPMTHNGLGVVLHTLGHEEKSRESFRRALQIAPHLASARENLQALGGQGG